MLADVQGVGSELHDADTERTTLLPGLAGRNAEALHGKIQEIYMNYIMIIIRALDLVDYMSILLEIFM